MSKKRLSDKEANEIYHELLKRIDDNLLAFIREIEYETTDRSHETLPPEIVFDVIPILKQLKSAHKYVKESLFQYS